MSDDTTFQSYRIFLDHWTEITSLLQNAFEIQKVRKMTKGIIVAGKQGCGKSVLGNKLYGDFKRTSSSLMDGFIYDKTNIWHRIVGGENADSYIENVQKATETSCFLHIEDDRGWIAKAESLVKGNTDRSCVIIADNCEREYFIRSLLNVSDETYLQTGRTDTAIRQAAQQFVALCRSSLRKCLFVFFTNDEDFALAFEIEVNKQHSGLIESKELKMPIGPEKEAIVRINVNRLNPFSYWLCIDRAGPNEKIAVWDSLNGAATFPAAFEAVDNAIQSSAKNRTGRPARTCVINAVVLTNSATGTLAFDVESNVGNYDDIYLGENIIIRLYSKWDSHFGSTRDLKMLSTEWQWKVVILSDAFVSALLADDAKAKQLLDLATTYLGPGVHTTTKAGHFSSLQSADAAISATYTSPANQAFWNKGSVRSHDYESRLKAFYPTYNTKTGGMKSARPDLALSDYHPSSVLSAATSDVTLINMAIKREANMVEFTSIKDFTFAKLQKYIGEQKIKNYILATQEQ